MQIIIAANTGKAAVLAEKINNAVFIDLKNIGHPIKYKNALVFPCFLYKGHEYEKAVSSIKNILPDAVIMPPILRSEKDYFILKSIISQCEKDIFAIHKSKALDINDEMLWCMGDDPEKIIKTLKAKGINAACLDLLFINSVYHLKKDIPEFIQRLHENGISCKIGQYSILENKKAVNYIVKRITEYENNTKAKTFKKIAADKGNGEGNIY